MNDTSQYIGDAHNNDGQPLSELELLQREAQLASDAAMAAERQREERRKIAVLKAEIAANTRKCKEEAALADLEAQYGLLGKQLISVHTIDGMVVFKRKDGLLVRQWQDKYGEDPKTEHCRMLCRDAVVYPSLDEFDELVKIRPIILVKGASAVLELAGLARKDTAKK